MATSGVGHYKQIFQTIGAAKSTRENKRVQQSLRGVLQAGGRLRAGLLGMASAMAGTGAALVGIGLAARRVVDEFSQLTMAQASMRSTLAAQLPNYRAVGREMSHLAMVEARRLGYGMAEANTSMTTMLQTGVGAHRSARVFGTAMQLARVGGMDAGRAVQFLTDTMNMFRVEAAEGNETGQHFARRMATQLSVSANAASTNIEQLQQAFRYAGGELAAMGFESGEVMAALAGLSSMGLRGTTAGTRLRQAMVKLQNPTRATQRFFQQYNITQDDLTAVMFDSAGAQRDMGEIMTNLSGLFRRLPHDAARAGAMYRLFGLRGIAAGSALAGLTEAGERTQNIMERLRDTDVTEGGILDRQNEEMMRSFGMQMQQLRHGLGDLAIGFGEILFGAMDRSNEGFGTHVRNVAAAIRLSGRMGQMTAAERREWEALSPEVRESGQNYRELFTNLADVLRLLGDLARAVMLLINTFPRLTVIVGGLLFVLGPAGIVGAARHAAAAVTLFGARMTATTAAVYPRLALLGGAFSLLAVHGVGMLTSALADQIQTTQGLGDEMRMIRGESGRSRRSMIQAIPIVGNLAAQWHDVGLAALEAYRAERTVDRLHDERRQRQLAATADEQVEERLARMSASSLQQYQNMSVNERRLAAAEQMSQQSLHRAAQMMFARGDRTEEGIRTRLSGHGISGDRIAELTTQIMNLQRTMNEQDMAMAQRDAPGVFGLPSWLFGHDIEQGAEGAAEQLGQFEEALRSASARMFMDNMTSTEGPMSVPGVQDGYIQRGGIIRAASGDVVVSRQHLARAVSARRGAMVGPAMGEGTGDRTMAGPTASGSGGGSMVAEVPVEVVLDGDVIARAVGRRHIRHLERSGAAFAPEQRRTMRESGFPERLG
jgi:TP901 family phage tail tape measure protein